MSEMFVIEQLSGSSCLPLENFLFEFLRSLDLEKEETLIA